MSSSLVSPIMKISELITALEKVMHSYGDVGIVINGTDGFSEISRCSFIEIPDKEKTISAVILFSSKLEKQKIEGSTELWEGDPGFLGQRDDEVYVKSKPRRSRKVLKDKDLLGF